MKKMMVFLLLCAGAAQECIAGEGDYAVARIPAALLKNANAVKRTSIERFEVISTRKARYFYKVAYTILNEKGDQFAECEETYDKLHSISYIEGTLFNAAGGKIKSLKKSDIQDRSGTDEGTLADDNRVKYHNFYHKVYPYTVEYEVEIKYDYTMFYPAWFPQSGENMAVESATMEVLMPAGLTLRHKSFNLTKDVVTAPEKAGMRYTWSLAAIPAIEQEYYMPHWIEITPAVYMAPEQFYLEGYEGKMSSWKDFGKFVYALKAGKDVLPENIRQTVHTLTDGIDDPRRKIAVLYDFMQKNTRYISIQLGLGGWQPFDARYVATNRYGDCKALSNYMYSLLKEAGIPSYYSLIKAGDGKPFFITDFPSSQFNHVILCVPLKSDTVWLECTSQTLSPGYLSGFTSDRPVLLVNEDGGQLVKTPRYGLKDNTQERVITAAVDKEGNLTMQSVTAYRALQEDDVHSLINHYSKEKVLEYLKSRIDLPNYDVSSFDYKENVTGLPTITEKLDISAANYAQVSGKRIFISYNLLSKTHRKLMAGEPRRFDIELGYEYTDVDSVQISMPEGYQPEAMPKDISLESKFGNYTAKVVFENNKIIYYRKMEQHSGRFSAKDYEEMVKFYDKIYKADYNKVVLVKQ